MYGAGKWEVGPALDANVAEMQRRACVAASNLPDYSDADGDPANGGHNPSFAYCVTPVDGGTCGAVDEANGCDDPLRADPCTVTVTLTYEFHVFTPVHIEVSGNEIGFPSTIAVERESTFAITDIDLSPGRHEKFRHKPNRANPRSRARPSSNSPRRPHLLPAAVRDHRAGRFILYLRDAEQRDPRRRPIRDRERWQLSRLPQPDHPRQRARVRVHRGTTLKARVKPAAFGVLGTGVTVIPSG